MVLCVNLSVLCGKKRITTEKHGEKKCKIMTNRIRDGNWKTKGTPLSFGHLPQGKNGRKRGSRHGPSARGRPAIRGKPQRINIRGKPPEVIITVISTKERSLLNEVVFDNMRFLSAIGMTISDKPNGWLHRDSRVLAASKIDFDVGIFILNRDCFAQKEGRRRSQLAVKKD